MACIFTAHPNQGGQVNDYVILYLFDFNMLNATTHTWDTVLESSRVDPIIFPRRWTKAGRARFWGPFTDCDYNDNAQMIFGIAYHGRAH